MSSRKPSPSDEQAPRRAVLYARISEHDDRTPKVETQLERCRALAEREQYVVTAEFADDGISAYTGEERPGFDDLCEHIRQGRADVLVAVAQDRLARNLADFAELAAISETAGITWHTCNASPVNLATPQGKFLATSLLMFAELESGMKRERIAARFASQRSKGLPLWGRRPFGFEMDRMTQRPDEANAIRDAAAKVIDGASLYSIAQAWNAAGLRSTRVEGRSPKHNARKRKRPEDKGGRPWNTTTVRQVLRRPSNALRYEQDGQPTGKWARILDEDVYRDLCDLLDAPDRQVPGGRKRLRVAAGFARCSCGMAMRTSIGNGVAYLRCRSRGLPKPPECVALDPRVKHASYRADDLEAVIRGEVISAMLAAPLAVWGDPEDDARRERMNAINASIRELRDDRAHVTEQSLDRRKDQTVVNRRLDEIDAELAELEAEREELGFEQRLTPRSIMAKHPRRRGRVSLADAASARAELATFYDGLTVEERAALAERAVCVVVHPGREGKRIEVTHLVAPELNAPDGGPVLVGPPAKEKPEDEKKKKKEKPAAITTDRLNEVRNLIAEGATVYQACEKVGMSMAGWYKHRKRLDSRPPAARGQTAEQGDRDERDEPDEH